MSGSGGTVIVEKATGKLGKWSSKPKLDHPNNLLCKFTNILPAVLRGEMRTHTFRGKKIISKQAKL